MHRPRRPDPAFDLPALGGGPFSGSDLGVLTTGFRTRPVAESAGPVLRRPHAECGDKIQFVLVNTREAHSGDLSGQPQAPEERGHVTGLTPRTRLGFVNGAQNCTKSSSSLLAFPLYCSVQKDGAMKQIDKHAYGPWALVTGASSGIGQEFARQVAASGINVVLVARREERLKEVAAELTARYQIEARVVALDLGRDGILGPVREATDDLDIGLVVSNAGTGNPGPFISLPHERLREAVQLNVITHLDLAHHFGQRLAERGRGGIVLVSAVAAAGGLPYMANDSAAKAYVLNLGEALHVELRQAGVHVSVLVPVLVSTPVVARIGLDKLGLPAEPITPEQAAGEALAALADGQVSTLARADMSGAFEDMKGAVIEMISARLAASQPAH